MDSFKIVAMTVGLVFTLGFINASAISDQLNWKYNPAVAENDVEEAMADFQTVLLIAQSSMDSKMLLPPSCKCEGTVCNCCNTINIIKRKLDEEKDEQKRRGKQKEGKKKKEKKKKEKKKKEKKKKEEIRETACAEVQYKKEDSSFGIKVTFGSEVLFDGSKSATGGEPTCFKYPKVPGVEFCLDVTDFKSEEGGKTHGCVSISAKLAKPVKFQLGCFDLTPEQEEPSALTYYYSDPGEEAEEIDSPTGWVEIEENAPLPDEAYLIMGA